MEQQSIFIIFTFLQTFSLINLISLYFVPWIFCQLLGVCSYNLFSNFWCRFWQFLVLFWTLWMLIIAHKPCHVPYASQMTSWGTSFTEMCFHVSKEWFRSCSHIFLITKVKILVKKLLAVCPETVTRKGKKRVKN